MKNACNGLLSRPDSVKERSSKLEDTAIETSKMEKQREQRLRTRTEYPDCETTTKGIRYTPWEYQKERKEMKRTEEMDKTRLRISPALMSDTNPQIQEALRRCQIN